MTIFKKVEKIWKRLNAHDTRINTLEANNNILVLKGILTQSGTDDPVLTIIENTLGEIPVMGRTSAGLYTLTMLVDVFTENKTLWYGFTSGDATADDMLGVVRTSAKVLTISQADDTVAIDAFTTPIYIEVYP